jgi:hypothetical protein
VAAEEAPTENASVEETPAEDPPAQDVPSGDVPSGEASVDEDNPEPEDATWSPEAPRTEADVEADRFFAAFDDGTGPAPADDAAEGAAPKEAGEEQAADSSSDTGTEHEGGEQR